MHTLIPACRSTRLILLYQANTHTLAPRCLDPHKDAAASVSPAPCRWTAGSQSSIGKESRESTLYSACSEDRRRQGEGGKADVEIMHRSAVPGSGHTDPADPAGLQETWGLEQRVVGVGGLGAAQPVWRGMAGRTLKGGQLVVQQPRQRLSCFDARVDLECAGLLFSQPVSSFFARVNDVRVVSDKSDAHLCWECAYACVCVCVCVCACVCVCVCVYIHIHLHAAVTVV